MSSTNHTIKHFIVGLVRAKPSTCIEEVYVIATVGKFRFSDIVAFHTNAAHKYIIDPTIRYETSDSDAHQDKSVHEGPIFCKI